MLRRIRLMGFVLVAAGSAMVLLWRGKSDGHHVESQPSLGRTAASSAPAPEATSAAKFPTKPEDTAIQLRAQAQRTADPIARMEQRLERKRTRQLAGLARVCEVPAADMARADRLLADSAENLVELAKAGRDGLVAPEEFRRLERDLSAKSATAWCKLLVEADWGPQNCRDIANRCADRVDSLSPAFGQL